MGVRRIAAVARRWQIRLHFFLPLQNAMNKPILSVVPLLLLAAAGWVQAQESPASTARAGTMKVVQGQAQVTDARGSRALQPGDAVIFVELIYNYRPVVSARFVGNREIRAIASTGRTSR